MPRRSKPPTMTQGRNALTNSTRPANNGTKYARMPGRNIAPSCMATSALRLLVFFVPRHLNRFQFRLVRRLWIIVEIVERDHFFAKVGEPQAQRVEVWKLLGQ